MVRPIYASIQCSYIVQNVRHGNVCSLVIHSIRTSGRRFIRMYRERRIGTFGKRLTQPSRGSPI